ncbi:hypothetical protein M5D96_004996 [Drosophila gunungcola]|uniref:Uncharacterized protein n=1 Tax=Drosophila gunungcola TaxID=103775 RepID=A0A9P9YVI7_9MUSC|nr:hypothetical protein M5D96_004996 [Drosophila gunungcola]
MVPEMECRVVISETLKFLHLLFSKNSLLPLRKWVFNIAGHPLEAVLFYSPS